MTVNHMKPRAESTPEMLYTSTIPQTMYDVQERSCNYLVIPFCGVELI
jgi:hypothetical protein